MGKIGAVVELTTVVAIAFSVGAGILLAKMFPPVVPPKMGLIGLGFIVTVGSLVLIAVDSINRKREADTEADS